LTDPNLTVILPLMKSLQDFNKRFPTEESCIAHLKNTRFKDGLFCPHCGKRHIYEFSDNKTYKCADCRQKFTVRTGTIFGESKLPLYKWFLAIYLLSSCKKGISSVQLAEQLGVTQKTAWFLNHRIRDTYNNNKNQLSGEVEVDEHYVGGKEKNKHASKKVKGTQGRSTKTKTPVVGVVERKGSVVARAVESVNSEVLKNIIKGSVRRGTKVFADEYPAYNGIVRPEHRVNHSAGKYVIGIAHTNTIESFWALFKRGYIGIYHYMSRKHLQRYLNEFSARYNLREDNAGDRFFAWFDNLGVPLSYKRLHCCPVKI